MTQYELEKLYLTTDYGIFMPVYTYDQYIFEKNKETGEVIREEYVGLIIQKSAEEVYKEWLANKDNPPVVQPSLEDKINLLEDEIISLEEENMVLSEYVLELEMKSLEQEEVTTMTNEYVLDIDMRLTNIETK